MTDDERALGVLVHDLRTPLSVASGYLRLVRDGRVPRNTDPAMLLDRALEALRVISRLCVDADRWLDAPPSKRPTTIPAVQLISALAADLASRDVTLRGTEGLPAGDLLVLGDTRELADALAEVLYAAARSTAAGATHVDCAGLGDELIFVVRDSGCTDGSTDAARAAFDPWRCPGLHTVIACRAIVRAGGRWTSDGPERLRAAFSWAPGPAQPQ